MQFVRFVFMKNPDAGCVNLESKLSSVIMSIQGADIQSVMLVTVKV